MRRYWTIFSLRFLAMLDVLTSERFELKTFKNGREVSFTKFDKCEILTPTPKVELTKERQLAIIWWRSISDDHKYYLANIYYPGRFYTSLTGEEKAFIWHNKFNST